MTRWKDMFDGRLETTSPAEGAALAALPARRGVALLVGEGERPVLLLPAADIRSRVTGRLRSPDEEERRRLPDLQAVTRAVLWRLSHSPFQTDLHYLEISRALWPGAYADWLAWKPAWFVHVDGSQPYPHFARTQDVLASPGEYFGPFAGGRAAQTCVERLADAFDLCRDLRCLRQSPHGRRCSYGQMGRCLCPCDGTIGSAEYRRAVARAADFLRGPRGQTIEPMRREMRQAAAALEFEKAAAVKARLERLAELEGSDFAHVAPAEEFRFLLVQKGPTHQTALGFFADPSGIHLLGSLDYPLRPDQLASRMGRAATRFSKTIAGRAGDRSADPPGPPAVDRWAVGLVAHYLFGNPRRAGLILRWTPALSPQSLADTIEKSADALGLRLRLRPLGQPRKGTARKTTEAE